MSSKVKSSWLELLETNIERTECMTHRVPTSTHSNEHTLLRNAQSHASWRLELPSGREFKKACKRDGKAAPQISRTCNEEVQNERTNEYRADHTQLRFALILSTCRAFICCHWLFWETKISFMWDAYKHTSQLYCADFLGAWSSLSERSRCDAA